ncbi:MAG: 3-oxoacyl-[acyl-carrier-protein] reductase [Planctomycetota bacterium]
MAEKNEKRVAIVTGASRGIGREIAKHLAAGGCHIVAVARDAAKLGDLVKEIEGEGGTAEAKSLDLTDFEGAAKLVEDVADAHGRLDVLVNNAGITKDNLLMRMEDAEFDDVIGTNLKSVFVLTRAASRFLMRSKSGRLINIGSVSGVAGNKGQSNYAASKAALSGFTKSVAKELGGKGLTANVVAPGFIETDMTDVLPDEIKKTVKEHVPLRRFGQAEEIAAVVAFLASESAGYVTGQVLCVDGGLAM